MDHKWWDNAISIVYDVIKPHCMTPSWWALTCSCIGGFGGCVRTRSKTKRRDSVVGSNRIYYYQWRFLAIAENRRMQFSGIGWTRARSRSAHTRTHAHKQIRAHAHTTVWAFGKRFAQVKWVKFCYVRYHWRSGAGKRA